MGCGASSAAVQEKRSAAASDTGDADLTSKFIPVQATPGHGDWRDVVDHVPDIYQKKGYRIKDTAERGISLRQLQDLGALIETVLATRDVHITDRDGVVQTWEIVNLYVINTSFVKPLTWGEQISFVELVAESDQPPSWFISHWWGTAFRQSLRMLRLHHKTRGLEESSCYWMCTFANNQHALGEELNGELADSPFLRVLRSDTCCGTVALMDQNATPFSRIWCVLEAFEAMKLGETKVFPYDMAAWLQEGYLEKKDEDNTIACAAQASLLLDDKVGTTACEEADQDWEFPWIVAVAAARTCVKDANSTMPEDKAAILKYIDGREEELDARIHSQVSRAAMYNFCLDGSIAMIQELLCEFPSLLDTGLNNFGSTPAYLAAEKGQPEVLKLLISSRADIDKTSENYSTPTFIAAAGGNVECLQLLISSRADINKGITIGATPTYIAAQQGHTDALRLLVSSRADINKARDNGATPTFVAAKDGYIEGLRLLISSRADIEKSTENGTSPVFIAAQGGHTDVLELLISSRADIDQSTRDGDTPTFIAAQQGRIDALQLLVASRADIDKARVTGATPTFMATQVGHMEVLRLLISSRADIDKSTKDGVTPAFIAVQLDHRDVLELLIASHADIDKGMSNGVTPMLLAAGKSDMDALGLLIASRADVDKSMNTGSTPTYIAAQLGHIEALRLLITSRADIDKSGENGGTAAVIAAEQGHIEALRLLMSSRADINKSMDDGDTPLTVAEAAGHLEIAEELLNAGAARAG